MKNPGHYMAVCQFNKIHEQCRCPANYKAIKYIMCNDPKHEEEYIAKAGE